MAPLVYAGRIFHCLSVRIVESTSVRRVHSRVPKHHVAGIRVQRPVEGVGTRISLDTQPLQSRSPTVPQRSSFRWVAVSVVSIGCGYSYVQYLRAAMYSRESEILVTVPQGAHEDHLMKRMMTRTASSDIVGRLLRDSDLVLAVPLAGIEQVQRKESRIPNLSNETPTSKYFMADIMPSHAMVVNDWFHKREPCLYQTIAFGEASEGAQGPYQVSRGPLAAAVQEASRDLAQYWFPKDMTYRLTDTWINLQEDCPLVNGTTYCVLTLPLCDMKKKDNLSDALGVERVRFPQPQEEMAEWLDLGRDKHDKNIMAVLIIQGRHVEWIENSMGAFQNYRTPGANIVGMGFVRFDVGKADWQARSDSDWDGRSCRRYAEALSKSGAVLARQSRRQGGLKM